MKTLKTNNMKKNAVLILFLTMGTQLMQAHPGLEHHAHDSLIGEWAWLIVLGIALIAFGRHYVKRQMKNRVG